MPESKPAETQLADFEKAMAELETIVETLESEDIDLEQSLSLFERGMELSGNCRDALQQAELKVTELMESMASEADADEDEAEDEDRDAE